MIIQLCMEEMHIFLPIIWLINMLLNNHPAAVTFGALTVLIVISCVVVFLVFLKRRQMNKYEKY